MEFHQVGKIDKLQIYPIKSCRGQYVDNWPISKRGLLFDREFAILSDETQKCLSLKKDTRLRHILPFVDLERRKLRLTFIERDSTFDNGKEGDVIPEFPPIEIDLDTDEVVKQRSDSDSIIVTVGSDNVAVLDCGKEVREFLERGFGEGHSLVRNAFEKRFSRGKKELIKHVDESYSTAQTDAERDELDRIRQLIAVAERSKVALPNEAQYLLVTRTSLQHLSKSLEGALNNDRFDHNRVIDRMRPNIIVDDTLSNGFDEEKWHHVRLGSSTVELDVTGACKRCPIVAVELDNGVIDAEPLSTLNNVRNKYLYFGIHANNSEQLRHELKRLRRTGGSAPRVNVGDGIYASQTW